MTKPQVICITGTHGTGKSTLVFKLAAHYKQNGHNVKIIQEVARSCPFKINDKMSVETALWIYFEHSKKELEAIAQHDIVITDRSSYDSFIYADHFGLKIDKGLRESAKNHLQVFYDQIYLVRSSDIIFDDGVRSTDRNFQRSIEDIFFTELKDISYIPIDSDYVFSDKWKKLFL